MVSRWDLRRRVVRLAQGDGAGARLRVGGAAGYVVFGRTQRGDGAARGQHRPVLETGGEGGGGGGGRRQVDLSVGAKRSQGHGEGGGWEGAACCHGNLQLHHHLHPQRQKEGSEGSAWNNIDLETETTYRTFSTSRCSSWKRSADCDSLLPAIPALGVAAVSSVNPLLMDRTSWSSDWSSISVVTSS